MVQFTVSQQCSNCGEIVKKTLSERTHQCSCGYAADRVNAAINILNLALKNVS
ncbi:transposase [Paenibacillus sp. GP183]|uniref:transposase n=1 Tax=Paenibacillus sp. GP183 TaxID=1882751 RepID=UPI000AC8091A|nr:transposase [Paenibacillus sp. GP183]